MRNVFSFLFLAFVSVFSTQLASASSLHNVMKGGSAVLSGTHLHNGALAGPVDGRGNDGGSTTANRGESSATGFADVLPDSQEPTLLLLLGAGLLGSSLIMVRKRRVASV